MQRHTDTQRYTYTQRHLGIRRNTHRHSDEHTRSIMTLTHTATHVRAAPRDPTSCIPPAADTYAGTSNARRTGLTGESIGVLVSGDLLAHAGPQRTPMQRHTQCTAHVRSQAEAAMYRHCHVSQQARNQIQTTCYLECHIRSYAWCEWIRNRLAALLGLLLGSRGLQGESGESRGGRGTRRGGGRRRCGRCRVEGNLSAQPERHL